MAALTEKLFFMGGCLSTNKTVRRVHADAEPKARVGRNRWGWGSGLARGAGVDGKRVDATLHEQVQGIIYEAVPGKT